jgi:hypothetical protein
VAVPAAVALVAVAMAATWLLTDSGGDGVTSATSTPATAPPGPSPSTSTPPSTNAGEPGSDELESVVDELSAFVESERELEFIDPVDVELADDDEFEQRLLDDFEAEDEADIRDTEAIFRALGFIDADVDLVDQLKGVLSAGVVGFYDPETNELVVRGTEATPYARKVIVHELTHAIDDQHFELYRPEMEDADDETASAFTALVEGNAVTVEEAYADTLPPEEADEADEEEAAIGEDTNFDQFPQILLDLIGAPYQLGPPLVDAIIADGGEAAVDAAIEDPPVSSEQVLDPSLFLSGEQPLDVAEPPADGESFDQGTLGQLMLLLLLDDGGVDQEVARQAAIGWGGDQYVAWHDGDQTCVRATFEGDTGSDTAEMAEALASWAGDRDGASVSAAGDQVILTSCG